MSGRLGRAGAALVEAIVAFCLGLVVIGVVTAALIGGMRESRRLMARADLFATARTVWVVLDQELRPGLPGRDWVLDESGVLSLRGFRGVARVCGREGAEPGWRVIHRGRRPADPARDSVLALGLDGTWRAFDLEAASSTGTCDGEPRTLVSTWVWSQPEAPEPVVARLFERGSYHLADGAFRYRRGDGGRQPLTPEVVHPTSRLLGGDDGVGVRLVLDAPGGARSPTRFTWFVRGVNERP